MKDNSSLLRFKHSLIEASKMSGSSIDELSRPVYLSTCKLYKIDGWTKQQILDYPNGWSLLKKDAMHCTVSMTDHADAIPMDTDEGYEEDDDCLSETDMIRLDTSVEDDRIEIIAKYAQFIRTYKYAPTSSTFRRWNEYGIPRYLYTSIQDLDTDYRNHYPEECEKYLFDKKSWTEDYRDKFREEVKKYKNFVFVSVGSFCTLDIPFLESLKSYAQLNNAMVIGLPLFKRYDKAISDFCVNPIIRNYMWVTFEDIVLNNNLMVQVIKANCTTKSTLTGINQMVAKYNSSIIVAGINQQIKYIPILKDKTPNMIASTGCCTEYEPVKKDEIVRVPTKAEKLAKERLSIEGALVVELGDDDTFSVRNIEAAEDGSFIDLSIEYRPEGSAIDIVGSTFVIGDLHAPKQNDVLLKANLKAIKDYQCSKVVLHDCVSMTYISHHNADQAITRAQLVEEGRADIRTEIEVLCRFLRCLDSIPTVEEIIIPYSNHPAHFEKFIQDISRMSKDDINLRTSLYTAIAMLDNKNVLQYLVEEVGGTKLDKVTWLDQDKGQTVHGVQVGLHGSERVNGGRMTTTSTNNAFPKTILAHRHTAGIDGNTVTVGIACDKDQGYNHGLSSWTESSAIAYYNGTVQLLTFVNVKGEYKLWL